MNGHTRIVDFKLVKISFVGVNGLIERGIGNGNAHSAVPRLE